MTDKPRIALVIGSTRTHRFADKPAQWMLKQARARGDMDVEVVDLRDHALPFFNEEASNMRAPSKDPEAIRWQETIGRYDGFIFVVAEYNRSITGVLKNAMDQAYKEWNRKPFTAIAYGGLGGARALEHLRGIGVELQMVPTRNAVHIAASDYMTVHPAFQGKPIEDIEARLLPSAKLALDDLAWWAGATMAARAAPSPLALQENKELTLRFFTGIQNADVADLDNILAPEFTYWIAPSTSFSGTYDRERFLTALPHLFADTARPFRFEFGELTAEEDRVALTARGSASFKNGKEYKNNYHYLAYVRDGQITGAKEYMDSAHVNDVFGAPAAEK